MIHVGLDTVQLKGEGFHPLIRQGDHVQQGEVVLEFDIKLLQDKGYNIITPVVVTNKNDYMDIFAVNENEMVKTNDVLLAVIAK